jgi:hypothetical protein
MLKHAEAAGEGKRPHIRSLLERLSEDGRSWAEAELALGRIELAALKRQLRRGAIAAVLALLTGFCALVLLSQAAILFMAPVVGGTAQAALAIGGALALIALLAVLVLRSSLQWRTESIFFRWLRQRPAERPS